MQTNLTPAPLHAVELTSGLLAERMEVNRRTTLPIEYEHCRDTGRLGAWTWKPGSPNQPHHFWDSDVAKWIEAAAYSLAQNPDPDLEKRVDAVIADMASAQLPDGYLNSYFIHVDPSGRWTNLRDMHELYCAGHLMEAAVAWHEATGKRQFLDIMCRYADTIATVFGPGENQLKGYPGHEEIELALIKLYRATGEKRYLDLACFFVDERGKTPYYYDEEARKRGEDPQRYPFRTYAYCQAHIPVREQKSAEGHSVRACYLYAGMADVAAETGDADLLAACRALWENITTRRMYITGGVGSTGQGERFTIDYDLPPETAYAETCAAIALMFFAHRMLQVEKRSVYADVMEQALYNNVLAGVSRDGDSFFYANPLLVHPPSRGGWDARFPPERQPWFGCACCPPNVARLLASLGIYVCSRAPGEIWLHLYATGRVRLDAGSGPVVLSVETTYPWDGRIEISVDTAPADPFTLRLRFPGWADAARLAVNGQSVDTSERPADGYLSLHRHWQAGDRISLEFPMSPQRIKAHPAVRHAAGMVALRRGPVVYCLEEEDNGADLAAISLPADAAIDCDFADSPFPGIPMLRASGVRQSIEDWDDPAALYRPAGDLSPPVPVELRAVPYFLWANRRVGEMTVWIRE